MFRCFLVLIILFSLTSEVWAKSSSKQGKKRTAKVDFADELITGGINKPELLYLLKQRQANYKKLIKFRKNFLPEMRKTSENLRQSRGED